MVLSTRCLRLTTRVLSVGRRRTTRCIAGVVVAAVSLLGAAMPAVAATLPTLTVVVLGSGAVASKPAGIACPGRCTATFAAGTSVLLTPESKNGSTFLRWGGSCTGTGACTVKVSTLTAVAAQFVAGPKTPPTTNGSVAVPGPYSGSSGQGGWGITFYAAPGGRSLQNISIPADSLSCTPSGGISDHLGILQVAVKPNGSFSAKTSQDGVFNGVSGKITYTIAGRFQAATATTPASAAGTWDEDVVFASGTTASCTSNNQSWTAKLYREPPWQKTAIEPGDYSGSSGQGGWGITFSVAPGGRSLQNISIPADSLSCTPSGAISDHLGILQVAVKPNGSFSAKTSQDGVFNGVSGKITYTIAGYFEGPTPAGAATVAGMWREDVVFASGNTKVCTSNDELWTVTRT